MLYRLRALLLILITLLLLPAVAAVCLLLVVSNLVYHLAGFVRRSLPADDPPAGKLASIIVLNWNGRELLAEGLPSILKAVHEDGLPHQILVVDNGSTDGSADFVKEQFPGVELLALEKNLGFGDGNNAGVRAARHDIVVLLNNDMVVDPGFLRPLLNQFGPATFAVSSQIYLQDSGRRREETGKTSAVFRRGMIDYSHRDIGETPSRNGYPVFWAGGGSSAFHKKKFLLLGGFREIYSPAYVEDTDLSYRAWKMGWEVLLAPRSIVYHRHRASTGRRFSRPQIQSLITRNQFLFIWSNIHSWRMLLSHCLFMPWNCYRLARDHGIAAWRGMLRAALRLPAAATAALRPGFDCRRKDEQVFELSAMPGHYFSRKRPRPAGPALRKPHVLWITAYLPHTGRHAGAGRMFQLLKRMSSKYRITLLTFLETDEERDFIREAEPFCEKIVAMRRTHPPRWKFFAYEPFDEFLTSEMEQAVDRCLQDCDIDLLQLEYTQMACYARRGGGIPSILTKHEVDFAACARRAKTESNPVAKFRWFYNYLQVLDREIKLNRQVDAVVCMTDPDADELRKFSPSPPIYTISTGVDLDYFAAAGPPAEAPRMIFVGAFQHLPNVDAMTYFCREILPLIREKEPAAELLIVGSNPPPSILSLEGIGGVRVTGFVPDIRPHMAASSIYVVPLRLGVGIRGKILEAWGMKMPVVTTSVGCAGLRYRHDENLVVADSPEDFASEAVSLLRDRAKRIRLGQEGRSTAEQFYSWDSAARELDRLYRKLIFGQSPASAASVMQ